MSNPGLYSSIYEQIREYAELVDKVLIGLKSGTSHTKDPSRQKLSRLLTSLAADVWEDLPTRLVALLLRDKDDTNQKKWAKLGSALLSEDIEPSLIQDLERLAITLEQEQIGTIGKMRGGLR